MSPYEEYDNVIIEPNPYTCPLPIVRNSGEVWSGEFWQQVQDETATYNASSVIGTPHLMTHNTFHPSYQPRNPTIFPFCYLTGGSIVRNGDYVYMEASDDESNYAARKDVIEYQISTGTTTRIQVHTFYVGASYNNAVGELHISYLMDRKILVAFEHNHGREGTAPNRYYTYHAHTVDFEEGTVTQELEWRGHYESAVGSTLPDYENMWPDFTMSAKDASGDVWGYVIGMMQHWTKETGETYQYLTGGIFIYYKNFTQDTEWGMVRLVAGTRPHLSNLESWLNANPVLIGNEKIVIENYDYPSGYGSYPSGYTGLQMFTFDIASQQLTCSSRSPSMGSETIAHLVYDATSGLLFFADYSDEDDEYYTVSSYDMSTDTWTYRVLVVKDPDWYGYYIALVCDKNYAYFVYQGDGKCYRADGNNPPVEIGTLTLDEWSIEDWHYAFVVDEYGPSFLWWDETDGNTLHLTALDGTELATYNDILPTPPTSWAQYAFDLGGCFVVLDAPFRQPIDYWLIT
jgi:hypothetical protein